MRRFTKIALTGALTGALVAAGMSGAAAEIDHQPVILPDCAVTFVPDGGDLGDAECLQPARETASASSGRDCRDGRDGRHRGCRDGHGHDDHVSYVVVTEHGPWGSRAEREGWHLYFVEPGLYYVPRRFNDQASAWASYGFCGHFHVHAPGTQPAAFFPKNRAGNFPYGRVGNDELSGVSVYDHCG
ncbi:hypothetical protein FOF52_03380 [Thermobifida alba]|uniref:Uncharacterized protein n=1 Tax=Thermobifida alba TaxID=53522 RepID=A0ABY4KYH7_THEAE|nr:hypothetical protein [Thermobifida alba]UPT20125.1 hypothetical protein FOF52_03380 [Thermobifida alba]HLU96069.1 hypothetical protein [Thermobifida alba]